jgi:predicted amidohydrolase YtcJ
MIDCTHVQRFPYLGLLLLGALSTGCDPGGLAADLALLNGNVLTVDATDRIAEAVAIRDGKVVAVGSDRDVERLIGPATRRVNLDGKTVTPGLMDAHAHFAGSGADRL